MGACIDTTVKKKKTTSTYVKKKPAPLEQTKAVKEPPPFRVMTEEQLIYQYLIEDLLPSTSTLEGPKYLSNRVTGEVKVMRIFRNDRKMPYDGLVNLKNLSNGELYKFSDDYLLMISQLLTGQSVLEFLSERPGTECTELLKTIYSIIISIHEAKICHGALTFDSFRFVSKSSKEIVLSQLNFKEGGEYVSVLNHNNQAADWEFFGILMSTILEGKLPYFSRENGQYKNVANEFLGMLLQGRPVTIPWGSGFKASPGLKKVLIPYSFRMTLYKLILLRGKRERMDFGLYDESTMHNMNLSRPMEDQLNKFERTRLINKLKDLLPQLDVSYREEFLKLAVGGPKLNEYEVLFTIHPDKRSEELTYRLSNSLN